MQYLANVQTNVAALSKPNQASSKTGLVTADTEQDFADILKASNDKAANQQAIDKSYQQKNANANTAAKSDTLADSANENKENQKTAKPAQHKSSDELELTDDKNTASTETKPSNKQESSTQAFNKSDSTDTDSLKDFEKAHQASSSSQTLVQPATQSNNKSGNNYSATDSFVVESADAEFILNKANTQTKPADNPDEFDFLQFLDKAKNNKAELKSVSQSDPKAEITAKPLVGKDETLVSSLLKTDAAAKDSSKLPNEQVGAQVSLAKKSADKAALEAESEPLHKTDKSTAQLKSPEAQEATLVLNSADKATEKNNKQSPNAQTEVTGNKANASEASDVKTEKHQLKQLTQTGELASEKQASEQSSVQASQGEKASQAKKAHAQGDTQQTELTQAELKIQTKLDANEAAGKVATEVSKEQKSEAQIPVQSAKIEPGKAESKVSAEVKQALQSASQAVQTEVGKEQGVTDKAVMEQAHLEQSIKHEVHAQQAKVNEHSTGSDPKATTAQVSQQIHRQEQQLQQTDKNVEKQQSLHQQLKEQINLNKSDSANALNDSVRYMMNSRIQSAEIRIDPPELGSMQIKISMNGDQASVSMVVQNQQAKDMLDQSVPKLKEMLEQQGIELGESNVSEHQNNNQEQQAGHSQGDGHSNQHEDGATAESHQAEQSIKNGHLGVVDYYA